MSLRDDIKRDLMEVLELVVALVILGSCAYILVLEWLKN